MADAIKLVDMIIHAYNKGLEDGHDDAIITGVIDGEFIFDEEDEE